MNKILRYITRKWSDESTNVHPGIKFLPPFAWEFLAYLIGLSVIYGIIDLILKGN